MMNDINVPAHLVKPLGEAAPKTATHLSLITYMINYPVINKPAYLCAEHTEKFKINLEFSEGGETTPQTVLSPYNKTVQGAVSPCDVVSFVGKPGFNYWLIEPSECIRSTSDKKIFNLYLSYTDQPRQFY